MRPTPARTTRTSLSALLEGNRTWGTFEKSYGFGVSRHRLDVYPPGISRDERIALRLKRAYSVWGLGLWLVVAVSLMAVLSPWAALGVATLVCLAVGAVVRIRSGLVHGEVRTLAAVLMTGVPDPDAETRHEELHVLADRLISADALLDAGAITEVEHEAEVWRVYDRIG